MQLPRVISRMSPSATRTAIVLALAAAATAAHASSPDAWAGFRAEVKARCLAGAADMRSPAVVVHPVGTQTHGIAVLIAGTDKRICIYDKRSKAVELTPAT